MKIVILGKGLAGTVFHVVSSYLFQSDKNVAIYYKESLPMQQRGLRYIHPPCDLERDMIALDKSHVQHLWTYIEKELNIQNVYISKELNWALMHSGGSMFPINGNFNESDIDVAVASYAKLNWRQVESNIMNGVTAGNKKARMSCINYHEIIAKLNEQSELFDSNFPQLHQEEILRIDLGNQKIKIGSGEWIDYDILINTIPLPVFMKLIQDIDFSNVKFEYSPAIYVSSRTKVDTKLDYYYNLWEMKNQDYYQLSRVVFKDEGLDFEFSVNPKYANSFIPILDTSEILQSIIFKHLRILNRMFKCDLSWQNLENLVVNKYAHFFNYDVSINKMIKTLEEFNVLQLGRYAQWNHGIKLNEIWNRSVNLCESIQK